MNDTVAASLGAEERLLPFLPDLLQDLFSLGFPPDPLLHLLARSGMPDRTALRVLDLGCGKGATLIALAQRFGWHGEGVDLMPSFIETARTRAGEHGVAERLRFDVRDAAAAVHDSSTADLILFAYDADMLGPLPEALRTLRTHSSGDSRVVLETVWPREGVSQDDRIPTEEATREHIRTAGFVVLDFELLDRDWMRAQNLGITACIRRRAAELALMHPEKRDWFESYVRAQEAECALLEHELECAFLLLAPA